MIKNILKEYSENPERLVRFDSNTLQMFNDLFETYNASGLSALNAAQIGYNYTFFILENKLYVNPNILEWDRPSEIEEICPANPIVVMKIWRFARIKIRYQDVTGQEFEEYITNPWLSFELQHECDHLTGGVDNKPDRFKAVAIGQHKAVLLGNRNNALNRRAKNTVMLAPQGDPVPCAGCQEPNDWKPQKPDGTITEDTTPIEGTS